MLCRSGLPDAAALAIRLEITSPMTKRRRGSRDIPLLPLLRFIGEYN